MNAAQKNLIDKMERLRADAKSDGNSLPPGLVLCVEARVWNEPGIYRVLSIGGNGHRNDNAAVARLLRCLADWVETDGGSLRAPNATREARGALPPTPSTACFNCGREGAKYCAGKGCSHLLCLACVSRHRLCASCQNDGITSTANIERSAGSGDTLRLDVG